MFYVLLAALWALNAQADAEAAQKIKDSGYESERRNGKECIKTTLRGRQLQRKNSQDWLFSSTLLGDIDHGQQPVHV